MTQFPDYYVAHYASKPRSPQGQTQRRSPSGKLTSATATDTSDQQGFPHINNSASMQSFFDPPAPTSSSSCGDQHRQDLSFSFDGVVLASSLSPRPHSAVATSEKYLTVGKSQLSGKAIGSSNINRGANASTSTGISNNRAIAPPLVPPAFNITRPS